MRSLVLVVALAIGAAACSPDPRSGQSAQADREEQQPTEAVDAETEQPAVELFAPTDTDRPYDLAGGATSSDDGVLPPDAPGGQLRDDVAQAVLPWPTDFSRRTIALDELLLGIPTVDPRDRIPPIDAPRFEPITAASWLGAREPGALVQFND